MHCAACERHLTAYVDDELTPEARLELEAHLDACEACRRECERLHRVWEAAQQAQAGPTPEGLWERIASELAPEAGGSAGLEGLVLMVRGLAAEVQDLRHEIAALRQAVEGEAAVEEGDEDETIRVQTRRFAPGRPRQASIAQLRRTS